MQELYRDRDYFEKAMEVFGDEIDELDSFSCYNDDAANEETTQIRILFERAKAKISESMKLFEEPEEDGLDYEEAEDLKLSTIIENQAQQDMENI